MTTNCRIPYTNESLWFCPTVILCIQLMDHVLGFMLPGFLVTIKISPAYSNNCRDSCTNICSVRPQS